MANALQRLKLGMLLFGSIGGALIGIREVAVSLSETEPTRFTAEEFRADYEGQQWLAIDGELALDHAHVRPSTNSAHAGKDLAYVHIPIVAEGWTPEASVDLVATFGPVDLHDPFDESIVAARPPFAGQVRPTPLNQLDERFPGLTFDEPPVVVNVGTEPSPPLAIGGFTIFMLLVALASGYAFRQEYIERNRPS